jgi:hypothetical protein
LKNPDYLPFQCLSCYSDAELEESSSSERHCYSKSMMDRVFSSTRWYYVLSMTAVVNFAIVVVLIVYFIRWRQAKAKAGKNLLPCAGGGGGAASNGNGYGAPVKVSNGITRPFHDFESSSEEGELVGTSGGAGKTTELYRKPYTDQMSD